MFIYNFTNPSLLPSNILFVQPLRKKRPAGKLKEELKNCDGGWELIEKLLTSGWGVKGIFFEIRKKKKENGTYWQFRVKVILSKKEKKLTSIAKILFLASATWESCKIYENLSESNLTFNFYHLARKSLIECSF